VLDIRNFIFFFNLSKMIFFWVSQLRFRKI